MVTEHINVKQYRKFSWNDHWVIVTYDSEAKLYFSYTYVHNGSVKIIYLLSHTTYVVSVNFIHKRRDQQFKVDSERHIFEKLFMEILFTLRVFGKNLLRGNHGINTFHILFWCLAWGSNIGFTSNKPTHYLLDYGDFNILYFSEDFIALNQNPNIVASLPLTPKSKVKER